MTLRELKKYCCLALIFLLGCGGKGLVTVNVVDEKSALENQILGSYKEIEDNVIILASVRSLDSSGKLKEAPPISEKKKMAIRAMQRRSFNIDDIERLKEKGYIGENNRGYLQIINPNSIPSEEMLFLTEIVKEENSDRKVIMERIIDVNENFSSKNMEEIEKTFAKLNRDNAKPGVLLENDAGEWYKK